MRGETAADIYTSPPRKQIISSQRAINKVQTDDKSKVEVSKRIPIVCILPMTLRVCIYIYMVTRIVRIYKNAGIFVCGRALYLRLFQNGNSRKSDKILNFVSLSLFSGFFSRSINCSSLHYERRLPLYVFEISSVDTRLKREERGDGGKSLHLQSPLSAIKRGISFPGDKPRRKDSQRCRWVDASLAKLGSTVPITMVTWMWFY